MKEVHRQATHVGFGAAIIIAAMALGRSGALVFLLLCLALALLLIQFKARGKKHWAIDSLLDKVERKNLVAKGALNYVVGELFLFSFAPNLAFAIGITAVFAFGDGISTVVGIEHGIHKLHFNKQKSWEGLAAFAAFGFVASLPFLGLAPALFYAVALAVVEGFDFGIDDNILIPAAAIALNLLTGI